MNKYYLVGIKGTGMSSLACVLKDLGYEVIGSDYDIDYFTATTLIQKNIPYFTFGSYRLLSDYIYIIGNAYTVSNIEVNEIINHDYQYYYYHEFIGKILNKEIIAISGTHGKTTTTSFLVQMLDYKTSYIIGDGSGGGYLNNDILVLEACEYQNHFLSYYPEILVINNIELDHPDFFKNEKDVIKSFQKLALQSKIVVLNGDDKNCHKIKGNNILKVGMSNKNDIVFKFIEVKECNTKVELKYKGEIININIPFTGTHLIYDFILAYVVTKLLKIKVINKIYKLPKRRMTEYIYGNTILIDDYAHHPTEIKALYESIKNKYKEYPINVIFQPHTYSRTLKLKKQFIKALQLYDKVYIADVFTSAREKENLDKQKKINKIFQKFLKFDKGILNLISKEQKEIWIFLGAGEIDKYIQDIINK